MPACLREFPVPFAFLLLKDKLTASCISALSGRGKVVHRSWVSTSTIPHLSSLASCLTSVLSLHHICRDNREIKINKISSFWKTEFQRERVAQLPGYMVHGLLRWPVVKNPPANAGDMRDVGSIPGSGRSSGEGHDNPLQYSCLKIIWTEEPGRLQFMGSQSWNHKWLSMHTHGTWVESKIYCEIYIISPYYIWWDTLSSLSCCCCC